MTSSTVNCELFCSSDGDKSAFFEFNRNFTYKEVKNLERACRATKPKLALVPDPQDDARLMIMLFDVEEQIPPTVFQETITTLLREFNVVCIWRTRPEDLNDWSRKLLTGSD